MDGPDDAPRVPGPCLPIAGGLAGDPGGRGAAGDRDDVSGQYKAGNRATTHDQERVGALLADSH